ncbi:ABC transporter permease [Microbacterium murale]|uniref:Oligopeptide transport system permease protein n=1 Tax=Microbacterium murale TaxID=1081040 RepID=A0ABU0P6T3_9MICO|nr:ABC transporter permease [Microbacterium murale]MDQ0643039.1 oligopeptide transport system permease protein [Microbacterium murale]
MPEIPPITAKIPAPRTTATSLPQSTGPSAWRLLLRRPLFWMASIILLIMLAFAIAPAPFAGLFGNGDPRACDLADSKVESAPGHPFGFDLQGCDIWAGAVYGAQASITVGLLATGIALAIALVMGLLAGMGGGIADWIVSRLTEVFLGFPFLLAAIVVLNMFGTRNVLTVGVVLGVFGWPMMARLMRASVRSVARADHVLAARTMGLGVGRIVTRYVVPNAVQPVMLMATLTIGGVIVAESTLTYLGIGLSSPAISWGLQIAAGSRVFQTAPHVLVLPSIMLAVTVLAIVALGEELRTVFDPRERR